MKLDRNNIHSQWNEISPKNWNQLDKLCHSCHGNKKGGDLKYFGFFSSNFMKLCRNIHRSVWQLLGGVEKIQNGGRCHGNQGTKNVKFTPNFTKFYSNVSCHLHMQWNEICQNNRNRKDKLCGSCHGNKKRGDLKRKLISFIKLHETSQDYSPQCAEAFGVFIKFKMALPWKPRYQNNAVV